MLNLAYDDSAASQLIGYVYTALISVLVLSSMMLTSSTMAGVIFSLMPDCRPPSILGGRDNDD